MLIPLLYFDKMYLSLNHEIVIISLFINVIKLTKSIDTNTNIQILMLYFIV